MIVAGGLTVDNVKNCIMETRPWAVDVSSGVETGGLKDTTKIQTFIKNAKEATVV